MKGNFSVCSISYDVDVVVVTSSARRAESRVYSVCVKLSLRTFNKSFSLKFNHHLYTKDRDSSNRIKYSIIESDEHQYIYSYN